MKKEKKQVEKGTNVLCPRKHHYIGTIKNRYEAGRPFSAKAIKYDKDQKRKAGEPPLCTICGSRYFVQNKLYTSEGWTPSDPQLEVPPLTRR